MHTVCTVLYHHAHAHKHIPPTHTNIESQIHGLFDNVLRTVLISFIKRNVLEMYEQRSKITPECDTVLTH